ncbi:MAG: DUF6754 domain-containing protein [Planctomycetota bacterium]
MQQSSITIRIMWLLIALCTAPAFGQEVSVRDAPWEGGENIVVEWNAFPDDGIAYYTVERSKPAKEINEDDKQIRKRVIADAIYAATRRAVMAHPDAEVLGFIASMERKDFGDRLEELIADEELPTDLNDALRTVRADAKTEGELAADEEIEQLGDMRFALLGAVEPSEDGEHEYVASKLIRLGTDSEGNEVPNAYQFVVTAVDADGNELTRVMTNAISPRREWFDGTRFFMMIIVVILCGSLITFILLARSGRELYVRKIAGLEAVDEAVGRATEMGRPVLFVPGIQDVNEVQTIAGLTILNRVARTSAEYDAKVEVPTARSLVMTAARETVEGAFLAAGRPDAYNPDSIYYVSNEQFGYVAYLSGMMVRDEPAACFYMGAFFAESLILAETGNAIGAIQIAGTAQPAQLPFFVAACDYTLIGEEFYAASAYLSGSPEELGSLKGQDVGKVVGASLLILGVFVATLDSFGIEAAATMKDFLFTQVLR